MCTVDGEFAHRPRGRQGLLHLDGCYVAANYSEVEKCAQSTENLPIDLVDDRASCTWMGAMLL